MQSIFHYINRSLTYNPPNKSDYAHIEKLFQTEFYQYVKSNWNMDDILMGNSLLPEGKDAVHSDLEFNYIVNNKDQQLVAYIKGYFPLINNSLWIQILAVNSPFIRQGYGRLIMKELILHLIEKSSISCIYLTCHNRNIIGIHFWESLGFTKIYNIKSTHGLYKVDLRSLTCIPNHLKP